VTRWLGLRLRLGMGLAAWGRLRASLLAVLGLVELLRSSGAG
jgi:hypothetical protein